MHRFAFLALSVMLTLTGLGQAQSKTPQWIWFNEPDGNPLQGAPNATRYFRKVFSAGKVGEASISLTADNSFTVWVNGQRIGEGNDWANLVEFSLTKSLLPGDNVIAVEANNEGGPAGLVVHLKSKGKMGLSVVSDGTWKASDKASPGWQKLDFKDAGWKSALVLGPYGSTGPWGGGGTPVAGTPKKTRFTVPEGFVVETIVPATARYEGLADNRHTTYVNMGFDSKGRLMVSQEQGPILLVEIPQGFDPAVKSDDPNAPTAKLRVYCDQVRNCQGMCWVGDMLYLVGDGPKGTGLYKCKDTNGDDKIDKADSVTFLHRTRGGMGEHGPHAIIHGPDDHLYFVVGNHAFAELTPEAAKAGPNPSGLAKNSPIRRWPTGLMGPDQDKAKSTEDVVIPRLNDANGHASNILAPGGTIWRMDKDGKNMGLFSAGYRNQYDGAFSPAGELFVFDSDMEWDVGLPWYRHVRVTHATPGSDFGWRTGAANQMAYLFDMLPPLVDTGRGSPVGVEYYDDTAFPEKYRTLYLADWSIGVIYAIHMKAKGGTYEAEAERFCVGSPMNVTDLGVGPDGALYFTVGGRNTQGGVFRIRHPKTGRLQPASDTLTHLLTAPQPYAPYRRAEFRKIIEAGGLDLMYQIRDAVTMTNAPLARRLRAMDLFGTYAGSDLRAASMNNWARFPEPELRAKAVYWLGVRSRDFPHHGLEAALADSDALVRRRACEAYIRADKKPDLDKLWPVLGDADRFVRFAARSLLERYPAEEYVSRLAGEKNLRVGLDGIVALCRSGQASDHAGVIFGLLTKNAKPADVNDQLDVIRATQLAFLHVTDRPEASKSLANALASQFPHGDKRHDRELAVLLAHFSREKIRTEGVPALLVDALKKAEGDREQQIHYFYCLRIVTEGWTSADRSAVLSWFDGTQGWQGGNSFAGFLQNIFKDWSKNLDKAEVQAILAQADAKPWSALAVLKMTADKDLPSASELADLYDRLSKKQGQPRVKDFKDQIIASLSKTSSVDGQATLRKIADRDPAEIDAVAKALSKFPTPENAKYLVAGLQSKSPVVLGDVVRSLQKSTFKPTVSNPTKAGEGAPFRAAILAGSKLPEKDRWQAVTLLRRWNNKQFSLEDRDWRGELEGWSKWYAQSFPEDPPLPNFASLTAPTKWKMAELVKFLDKDTKGDVARGAKHFEKANCAKCHKFGKVGEGVGPDLTALKARFRKTDLVESILFPSKVVSDQYRGTTFVTKAGVVINGLASLQGDTYTILQIDGTKTTLRRSDVDQQVASTISVMPEKLLDEMTREEIADLVAFLFADPPK